MKLTKILATAFAVSTVASSAFAADLPSRKAPVAVAPAPMLTWTGFYVGLNAGYAFGGSGSTLITTFPGAVAQGFFASTPTGYAAGNGANGATGSSLGGFIGGGQVGWNYQFAPSFVAGIEADIAGMTGRSSGSTLTSIFVPQSPTTVVTSLQANKALNYFGTLRGRLGYLVTPAILLYATGGLAYGEASSSSVVSGGLAPPTFLGTNNSWIGAASYSGVRAGWTVGAGAEWKFATDWSVKIEYLYYDLGSANYGLSPLVSTSPTFFEFAHFPTASTRFNGHVVRAGVNYHFNFGGPSTVVAKY